MDYKPKFKVGDKLIRKDGNFAIGTLTISAVDSVDYEFQYYSEIYRQWRWDVGDPRRIDRDYMLLIFPYNTYWRLINGDSQ